MPKLGTDHGAHCAIGSFFAVNPKIALYAEFIDEVAAVNDSVPQFSCRQRKLMVERWLKWKLKQLGMPGFEAATAPKKSVLR